MIYVGSHIKMKLIRARSIMSRIDEVDLFDMRRTRCKHVFIVIDLQEQDSD
jgi:hypothetical protein